MCPFPLKQQAVVTASNCPTFDVVAGLSTGAAVSVRGEVVESLGKGQAFELQAIEVVLVGACSSDYPLQKKRTSLEFLRSIAHLRARTNTIAAVARVRSTLAFAVCSSSTVGDDTVVDRLRIRVLELVMMFVLPRPTTLPLLTPLLSIAIVLLRYPVRQCYVLGSRVLSRRRLLLPAVAAHHSF